MPALPPPEHLSLPPPQTFDILPALHEILARIDHKPPPAHDNFSHDDSKNKDIPALYDQPPLEPKDLPTEILQIKSKIRKALRLLEMLPDMERSVEEQEVEIRELEGRIKRQREMIGRVGERAQGMRWRLGS